ncbi:MAG: hypothetical protein HRU23_19185 [Gammaproteobacteria bacterium]|nr:hypothetical protein [Gammaproteobacteria bacterium]
MARNKANEHLINNLSKALHCATALDKQGLTINSVELEGRKPRIIIENNKRLQQVKSISVGVLNTAGKRFEKLSTEVKGTDVQWLKTV